MNKIDRKLTEKIGIILKVITLKNNYYHDNIITYIY